VRDGASVARLVRRSAPTDVYTLDQKFVATP
jgi:hypothetical protein